MLDALRDLDWAPRSLRQMRRDLDGADRQAAARARSASPNEDEIAGALSMSRAEYDQALDQMRTLDLGAIRQLDATGEDGSPLLELCIDPDEGPDAQLRAHRAARRCWPSAIRELPERERQILALYYEEELTMAEIGEVIGVCESRVSQLRSLALVAPADASCATSLGRTLQADEPRSSRRKRSTRCCIRGDRRSASGSAASSGDPRTSVIALQLPPSGSRLEGADPLAALPARSLRAQRGDVAVGVPARGHRGVDRVGRAVHVLRVPDVAARSDGVLRPLDAAVRRARRRSSSTRRSPSR